MEGSGIGALRPGSQQGAQEPWEGPPEESRGSAGAQGTACAAHRCSRSPGAQRVAADPGRARRLALCSWKGASESMHTESWVPVSHPTLPADLDRSPTPETLRLGSVGWGRSARQTLAVLTRRPEPGRVAAGWPEPVSRCVFILEVQNLSLCVVHIGFHVRSKREPFPCPWVPFSLSPGPQQIWRLQVTT